MRTNKKILLTILSGFICFGQVFGQTDEQKAVEQRLQAACDEYWNGLASGINKRKAYKDREEYLQMVKFGLLHDNNDGTVLLDEFASEYLPNTFAKYEKAREKSLEIGQNLKSVFTKQLDNNSPEWSTYLKATEKYSQILWDEKRIQNGISYIYLLHKVGAYSDELLAALDKSEKMNFTFENDFKHDLNQYQTKKVDGVMEFAQKNMPETFALLETFEKEINETKVQFDGLYAEAVKLNYFLGNTTHPVFVAFEFKYRKTIEKYNTIMLQVKDLQVKHLLLEVTGEDLASQDNKIAKEHKVFKDSLSEFVKTNALKGGTLYVEEIIETMVRIPDSAEHKGLYFGKYEVTQVQWQLIMGKNPSSFKGDLSLPVENVSWNDCQKFIEKLNSYSNETGYTFFLPTKEQWEYACRAGSKGKYGLLADGREGTLDEMGWYEDNSGGETHPVGQKKPNAWGLYDMHGNVWEWTASVDNINCRVCRGGSWDSDAELCGRPGYRHGDLGLRLAASRTGTSVNETVETKTSVKEIIETMVQIPGKDYLMGKYEVTQAQWQLIMDENPSLFQGDLSRPVEKVSWNDCQEFIKKLNARSDVKSAGIIFRLPTEEEWEYACRAGSTGKYGLLEDGCEGTMDEMGWYKDNSGGETHPVGQKKPNAWGLYDMHGNVYERTASLSNDRCINRGCCFFDNASLCASGFRFMSNPEARFSALGIRLAASRTGK